MGCWRNHIRSIMFQSLLQYWTRGTILPRWLVHLPRQQRQSSWNQFKRFQNHIKSTLPLFHTQMMVVLGMCYSPAPRREANTLTGTDLYDRGETLPVIRFTGRADQSSESGNTGSTNHHKSYPIWVSKYRPTLCGDWRGAGLFVFTVFNLEEPSGKNRKESIAKIMQRNTENVRFS